MSLSDGVKIAIYALYRSKDEELSDDDRKTKYYIAPSLKHWGDMSERLGGSITAIHSVFRSLGLLKESGEKLVLDKELEAFIVENIETGKNVKAGISKKTIEEIRKVP